MRTIERTWDRNEKENTVSKCFASLCFSETMWGTHNDRKKNVSNKRQQITLYIKSHTHSHWRRKEYDELRKPPWKISTTFYLACRFFIPFVRSFVLFFLASPFRIHFVRLLIFKPSKASCRCACWYRFNDENVATAARVVQYIRYEIDDESKVKCTHSTQEKYSFSEIK